MSFDFRRETLGSTSVLDIFRRWYHVPALAAAIAFMFWVRVQSYDRFIREDGGIWLQAVDSWYHWRTTTWTVENYPRTMPYEAWTGFPEGNYVGQFGTLFDQIVATVALIIGLGNPTEQQILVAALFTVPAMAALVAIPTYFIGRRLGGRVGGLAGVAFLALAPGTFLSRTTAGMFQHHVAEALFMTTAVLATMVALRVAEIERPVYELVTTRDWDALRRPGIYSALAGFAVLLYVWSWPPGVVLVGILGVYYVLQLSLDFVRGRSPDHVAFVGAVSMGIVAVGTALLMETWSTGTTDFGYLQPTLAALVAVGCLFMAWLARQWEHREYDPQGYPIAVAGMIVVSLLGLKFGVPDFYSQLISNLTGRLLPAHYIPGLELSTTGLTVAEVQPPQNVPQHMFREYGLAFYTAVVAIVLLALRPLFGREQRAEHLLVVVWALFLISMGMTQVRFNYYLVVAVAVLNAYLVGLAIEWIDLSGGIDSLDDVESYQILTLGVVIMVLLMPLLPPIAAASAVDVGQNVGPSPDAQKWEPANEWLQANTPEEGNYAGAGNQDRLDYMGHYEIPPEENFDYPEGAYGVLSWWDYGHLITVQGERIPHSNPFQQHAASSSAFLTADSEERGELVLDSIAAGGSPRSQSNDELRGIVDEGEADEEIRYVMVSDTMVGGKFSAITRWTDPATETYFEGERITLGEEEQTLTVTSDAYDETMAARLYLQDTRGLEHYRLVHETEEFSIVGGLIDQLSGDLDPLQSAQIGGDDWNEPLSENGQTPAQLDAMFRQANRANQAVPLDARGLQLAYNARVTPSVKTFERVEGAALEGQTLPNATVTVQLPLETNANRTFVYAQRVEADEDGTFAVTVPYPTDEELGPEDGYAEAAVVADGDYEVTAVTDDGAEISDVAVPETAVQSGETIEVELEEADFDIPEEVEDGNETDGGDEDADDADADEEATDGGEIEDEMSGEGSDARDEDEDERNETPALAPVRP